MTRIRMSYGVARDDAYTFCGIDNQYCAIASAPVDVSSCLKYTRFDRFSVPDIPLLSRACAPSDAASSSCRAIYVVLASYFHAFVEEILDAKKSDAVSPLHCTHNPTPAYSASQSSG